MPKNVKADDVELDKRLRLVQEWLIDEWPVEDIITQIKTKWDVDKRQAQRYISKARTNWNNEEQEVLEAKRRNKVRKLQKLARSLKESHKGTPEGIRAMVQVEKLIIDLENLKPAKKIEHSGPGGKPIQTENVGAVVLYIPSNGRDILNGGK